MLKCEDCSHIGDDADFPIITEEEILENADAFADYEDMEVALEYAGCPQCPECGSTVVLDEDGNRPS